MVTKQAVQYLFLSWILMIGMSFSLSGHTITYVEFQNRSDLVLNDPIIISDLQRNEPTGSGNSLLYVANYQASVHLIYGRENRTDVSGKYWAYRIHYDLFESTSTTPDQSGTLTISHSAGQGVYEALENYTSTTGSVRLVVTGIEASQNNFQTPGTEITDPTGIDGIVPQDIRLELRMNTERFDYLDKNAKPTNHEGTYAAAEHNFKIQWSHVQGAENYEIEWLYLDEEVNVGPTVDESYFKRAARVEVIGNEYDLSVTYPDGKLYYRIRGVGRYIRDITDGDYSRIKNGEWTDISAPKILTPFEDTKNWQYTTTFAEEGKYKKVISYYDEGLKNRQTQTNLSSDEQTLVATSHYDVEGRPTLSILPVPALDNNDLFYKPKFNINDAGQTYNRINFDKDLGDGCQYNLPDPLRKDQGAAYYFSPDHATNIADNDLYKEMIPDAKQYPMTQVRFLNDGTGRIAAQSGVGEFFQLGSGRETRYFYDDPSSFQLHRLFGSNVGEAKYYKRNLVMDANGQLSVSYVDIAGRVVATALTGVAPENVEALDSYASEITITENLLKNNVIIKEDGVSKTTSMVMNEVAGKTATFSYSLEGLNEALDTGVDLDGDGSTDEICLGCEYKVKIRVYDPCGAPVVINNELGARSEFIFERTFSAPDGNCIGTYPFSNGIDFSITMSQIGLYRVEKELQVVELGIDYYLDVLDSYFPDSTAMFDLVGVDSLSCYVTCEQRCRYEYKQLNANAEPDQAYIDACVASYIMSGDCGDPEDFNTEIVEAECEGILTQILNQVTPEGCKYIQGAWWLVDVNGTTINLIAGLQFPYNGSMVLGTDPNLQTSLQNPDEWQEEWAVILAEGHPEYCQYQMCIHSKVEREWEFEFRNMLDWNGLVWPTDLAGQDMIITDLTGIPNPADPMYNTSLGFYPNYNSLPLPQPVKDAIASALVSVLGTSNPPTANEIGTKLGQWMQNRLSLLNVGGNGYGECTTAGSNDNVFDYLDCALPNASDAEKWEAFRGIYMGEKNKLRNEIRRLWCPAQDDCSIIGDSELYDIPAPVGSDGSATEAAGNDFINDNNPNICGALCEYRVEEWLQEIVDGCPDLLDPAHATIYDDVKEKLFEYCTTTCGPENPLAYLLTEDLNTGALAEVDNLIGNNNLCGGLEADVLNEIAVPFSTVYTYYLDNSGAQVCTTSTEIDPCFFSVIDGLRILIQSGCTTGSIYTPGSGNNCYTSIQITNGGSDPDFITITGGGLSCCPTFEIVDLSGDRIDPCSLDFINTPWVDNGDIFINGIIETPQGITQETYQVICSSASGFLGGPDFVVGPTEDCLYSTNSFCYVIPINDFIDIDTIFEACIEEAIVWTTLEAERLRQNSIDEIISRVISQRNCLDGHKETFTVEYPTREHHYTLYYYDQAGNLIETVPPEGVNPLPLSDFTDGVWTGTTEPVHSQRTKYQYNTLGQVVWQNSPDGGATEFKYDYAQRLRVSKNAKQEGDNTYSYTRYDAQGRIIEVGELKNPIGNDNVFNNLDDSKLNDFAFPKTDNSDGVLEEQTYTDYNIASQTPGGGFTQENLRGRVALTYNSSVNTHYSYDEHGNVKDLQHKIAGLTVSGNQEFQTLHYDYDLISGNVKEVAYQSDKIDQFYHRYEYDADNRLTYVHTSENGWLWENDARYFYYAHGPLARVEMGEDKVQGMDYYYTLQGWIKGVNSTGANSHEYEAGKDGHLLGGNRNKWLARDAYAYALQYHDGDYTSIGSTNLGGADTDFWNVASSNILGNTGPEGLYNGNIVGMLTDIKQLNVSGIEGLQAMSYQYDQLHRIKEAQSYNAAVGTNNGDVTFTNSNTYQSNYTYDANGNLKTLNRWGQLGQMDQLTYTYASNKPNQLSHVDDGIGGGNYGEDVDDQNVDNYGYDAIGNLTKDVQGQVNTINWTVYGKVHQVFHAAGAYEKTVYQYDPAGNRLSKKRVPNNSTEDEVTTYYVRDASGNVMAVYEKSVNQSNPSEPVVTINQKEVSLYGSARLGQRKFSDRVLGGSIGELIRDRGQRGYEVSNHLGNVLSVVSDYKVGVDDNSNWEAEYYLSKVKSAQDYYAFGMTQPGRSFVSEDYRYGFNGKEKDEDGELGLLTHYDYGFRIYNPGISRFLSTDPIAFSFPWYTPYQFAGNNPIKFIDLDGLEPSQHGSDFDFWEFAKEKFLDILFGPGGEPSGSNFVESGDEDRRIDEAARAKRSARVTGEGINRVHNAQTIVGEIIVGATPFGWAVDIKDFNDAAQQGDGWGVVVAGIGFLPGGDLLKGARKFDNVVFRTTDDAVEVYGLTDDGVEVFLHRKRLSELEPLKNKTELLDDAIKVVNNTAEFFNNTAFGKNLKGVSQKTSKRIQGQSIHKVTGKNDFGLKKGDHYYLDGLHKDHLEVFDSRGNFKKVLNLDGTVNSTKTKAAAGRKIDIK